MVTHLRAIDSYWCRDVPLVDKLRQFASTYAYGLSPSYWFLPNEHDLVRHRMMGYGNLGFLMLPFVLTGTLLCLRHVRSSAHRALLLATLAAPAGAATADIAITRMMAFVPPACIIAGLGLNLLLEWVGRALQLSPERPRGLASRPRSACVMLALLVFTILSGASLWMLHDALANGPTWYSDFGLYGMQYGARQLFAEAIPECLALDPDTTVIVSPNWANGADTFVRFFFRREQQFSRVKMHDVSYFMDERREISPDMLFVMTPEEYEQAKASQKFSRLDVERIIPYPDGRPAFRFVRLAPSDNMGQILLQEREARRRPVVESVEVNGQMVEITHSQFDGGQLRDLFDGDPSTLARGLEANPFLIEVTFPKPLAIREMEMSFGSMDFALTVALMGHGAAKPAVYNETYRGLPPDPAVRLIFDGGPKQVSRVRIEVFQLNVGARTHIHVRDIKFK
jgi:hypothetical protein